VVRRRRGRWLGGVRAGRPARAAASAALVRWEISCRSKGAKLASRFAFASSVGVGSRAQSSATSAQHCCWAVATRPARSGQHARAPVALGGDERLPVSGLEQRQRLRDRGALRLLGGAADLPRPARAAASAGACTRPRSPAAAPRARRGRCRSPLTSLYSRDYLLYRSRSTGPHSPPERRPLSSALIV
jgi:hypothetical protein